MEFSVFRPQLPQYAKRPHLAPPAFRSFEDMPHFEELLVFEV